MVRDTLHRGDGVGLTTARDQELGRLVQREQEEARQEHDDGDRAQRQHEVSPAPVVFFRAGACVRAREVGDEAPGQCTVWLASLGLQGTRDGGVPSDEIANRPENSHAAQHIPRRSGQELQEDSCVHGQIASNTQAQAGKQSTHTARNPVSLQLLTQHNRAGYLRDPVWRAPGCQTERATQEQSHVKCRSTSNGVRCKSPEGGANDQSDEQRAGRESDVGFRDVEFHRQLGQCQGDSLDV